MILVKACRRCGSMLEPHECESGICDICDLKRQNEEIEQLEEAY